MKTLQQPLVIALFVAVTIVCFSHIWELIEHFALAAFGFSSLQWFYQATQNPSVEVLDSVDDEIDEKLSGELLEPQPAIAVIQEAVAVTEEPLTGTDVVSDLWESHAQIAATSDAVVKTVQAHPEPVLQETPDPVEEIVHQLESLPQKQNRRKVWSALCDRLAVKGGGKVRDANLFLKAKFLRNQGVTTPMLVKAKVSVLTLKAVA